MSKPILGLGLILICLTGCEKKQGNVAELAEGAQGRTSREVHNYTYDVSGNILTDNEVVYDFVNDNMVDTTRTTSRYIYDKNRLIEIDILSDVPEISMTKIYKYDHNDSLIQELWIELNADTTLINAFAFDENGNKVAEEVRNLIDRRTVEEMINRDRPRYDTFYLKWEHSYQGSDCILSRSINKSGEIESEIVTSYQDGKKIKAETYKYLGTMKYPHSTQTYDYTNYSGGEYVTIDATGLPIASLSVELRDGRIYKKAIMFEDYVGVEFLDDSGRLVKDVDLFSKRVTDYIYNEKGDKKEVFTFPLPDVILNSGSDSLMELEATQN